MFLQEQVNKVLIVVSLCNPIHHRPPVHFGTKSKVLIAYFIESKQQNDSFHLFTIINRNKLKSTHQCLSIEYFSQKGDDILNNNSINTHIDCFKTGSPLQVHIHIKPNKELESVPFHHFLLDYRVLF